MRTKQYPRTTPLPGAAFIAGEIETTIRMATLHLETYASINNVSVAQACKDAGIAHGYWSQATLGQRPMQARDLIAAFALLGFKLVPVSAFTWSKDIEVIDSGLPITLPPPPAIKPRGKAKPAPIPKNY